MQNQKHLKETIRINYKENDHMNKMINDEENEESFRHKKIYPVNLPKNDFKDFSKNKTNFKEISRNGSSNKKNNKIKRDVNVSEFRPKSVNSNIKE